jgi:hypothetical protein
LAVAGSVLTLAAAAPRVFSPGYTYRMRISGQVTEPNGKVKDYVAMSGRAMVTSKAGRLDIEEASKERGAMADKGGYILYDPDVDDDRVPEGQADPQVHLRGSRAGECRRSPPTCPGCASRSPTSP